MKRRLAMLLALTLTFASLSPVGVSAAEAAEPQEQIVQEISAEAASAQEIAEEEDEEAVLQNEAEETASEAASVTAAAEEETEAPAAEENAAEADTEAAAAEEAQTEEQGEAAPAGTTDASAEIAPEEEPAAEDESTTAATGEIAVIEEEIVEGITEEVNKEAEEKIVNAFWRSTTDGKRYYFNAKGVKAKGLGWLKHTDGNTYYIGADGAAYEGFKKIGGKTYFFWDSRCKTKKPQGAMVTGWQLINGKKFFFADSRYPGLPEGTMLTGWRKIQGNMYFFANALYPSVTAGTMMTGWRTIEGRKYYFGENGIRKTGFQEIGGKTYYFVDKQYSAYSSSKEGVMLTYSKKIGGKYYFFTQYGIMKNHCWVRYNDLLGYFHTDGTADTGWKEKSEGEWYYLKENGFAKTGWLKLGSDSIFYLKGAAAGRMINEPTVMSDGKLYFFDTDGRRATTKGWKSFGEYYYYTYENGTCAVNKTVDGIKLDELGRTTMTKMDMKAQGYYSDTNYLILCDKSTFTVCVYKGKKGAWVRIKGEWACTHGGSNTPEGEKTILGRLTKRSETYGWGDFTYTSAAFCMELSSGNFFHSILYDKGSRSNPYYLTPTDPDLYRSYSHGCIRLKTENAEWIWDNIPKGTKVVVYRS